MRAVNRKLHRNYSILEELMVHGVDRIDLKILRSMGFDEYYSTANFRDRVDGEVRFIYDLAYQQIGPNVVIMEKELESYRNTG